MDLGCHGFGFEPVPTARSEPFDMTRPGPDQELLPSILDRLIDAEPRAGNERNRGRPDHPVDLKASVRRDLEWLLNCRQSIIPLPPGSRLSESLLSFGLPDLTHSSMSSAEDQDFLRRAIERAIARFEPRLTNVVVTLLDGGGPDRALRFRIDAMLRVEPNPEPIVFDSVLRLPTRDFVIEES
jgi:type VI secretion system protein ImpF